MWVRIDGYQKKAVSKIVQRPMGNYSIEEYFNLCNIEENVYCSKKLLPNLLHSSTVYGGLLFAQSLAAAETTVPAELKIHSLHSMFIYAAVIDEPIKYLVTILRDGQSFCSRLVQAWQRGHNVFSCQLSFHKIEDGAIKHQVKMPVVRKPEECLELYEGIHHILMCCENGEKKINPTRLLRLRERLADRELAQRTLFEMRPVDISQYLACEPCDETLRVWCKSHTSLSDDSRIHRMLLLYNSDSTLAGTPVRYHQSRGFVPSQVFSLDHSAWIHSHDFRVDEWMLYESTNIVADGGRALTSGRLWTEDGRLICSTTQECLIRTRTAKSVI